MVGRKAPKIMGGKAPGNDGAQGTRKVWGARPPKMMGRLRVRCGSAAEAQRKALRKRCGGAWGCAAGALRTRCGSAWRSAWKSPRKRFGSAWGCARDALRKRCGSAAEALGEALRVRLGSTLEALRRRSGSATGGQRSNPAGANPVDGLPLVCSPCSRRQGPRQRTDNELVMNCHELPMNCQ